MSMRLPLTCAALVVLCVALSACSTRPTKDPRISDDAELRTDSRRTARVARRVVSDDNTADASAGPTRGASIKHAPAADTETSSVAPRDIWQRVRAGFAMPQAGDDTRVRQYLAWHQSKPDYLKLVTERAEPYLYFILEELARRQLPTELALLPIVESAYLPSAYSRSHAAGIWQFIPDTGNVYGLKQNWWYDGRRDVYASTLAALDYLKTLHEQFDGDWFHALAAYNAGPNRVLREIKDNRRLGKPIDFWHLDLPAETRNYVPKLLALKALVLDPSAYGIELWPVPDEPYLATVDIESQIDLALAARLADMEIEPFRLLNPGFSRWATDPEGPHRLLLPIAQVDGFKLRLSELPSEERVTWLRYPINTGDTLTAIAQRYGVSVSVLQQSNGLRSSRIRAGDHLLVPQGTTPSIFAAAQLATSRPEPGTPYTHVVSSGESLWSISRSYDVALADLVRWNGKSSGALIRAGDRLVIWGDSAPSNPNRAVINYSVQRGDSLYAIARRFKVTVSDLRVWNKMPSESLLYPGQAMTLYVDAGSL